MAIHFDWRFANFWMHQQRRTNLLRDRGIAKLLPVSLSQVRFSISRVSVMRLVASDSSG
jgi:hypothetical protein